MKPMPWRFLVVTDAGVDSGRAARVGADGAAGWLAALGAAVEAPAGAKTARLELRQPKAFEPGAIAARLGVTGAAVDAVLHTPAFQRVESAWRGLELLLRHAGEAVEVEVISLPRKGLAARFREAVFEPERKAASPLSLIVADFDFSHRPDDLALLGELATMAKVLQAPLVAGASAAFFDMRYLVQAIGLPDLVARLNDPAHAPWCTFQATEPARWVALTLNRYLQRAPYTAEAGAHAEGVTESNPDTYLWGRGVWLMAAAVARSVREQGHAFALAGAQGGRFDGLPTRAFPTKANVTAPLATEVALSEMQMAELHRAAFTPIVGPLRSDVALIPMAVTTFRLRPGKLTVEGTLAYQISAARLAQFCGQLLDAMPASGAGESADWLRRELTGYLGTLAGEKPEEAVSVEVRDVEIEGASVPMAEVRVRPAITLETRAVDFEFMLPLAQA